MFLYDWSKEIATNGRSNYSLRGYHIEALIVSPLIVLALVGFAAAYDPLALRAVSIAVVALSPIWVPLFIFSSIWVQWIKFVRTSFWLSQKMTLLEITLPPEVEKSPLAMELFLSSLYNTGGEATFVGRIWKGVFRPIWALEIASNEGKVSFYIHARKSLQNSVESRLYGQYPEAKITVVEDYAAKLPFNLDHYEIWGCEFGKTAPGAVPIKTYTDYQLDKNPDTPEIQVDPITNLLELMSSIGKDEYMWLQFILRGRSGDEWYGFKIKEDSYKEGGKKELQAMINAAAERSKKLAKELKVKDPDKAIEQAASRGGALLSDGEKKRAEAIERSLGKTVFDVGIRALYIAKKERFNGSNIPSVALMFNPFRSADLNSIVPNRGVSIFDYPWQDIFNIRHRILKNLLMYHYRMRAYFFVPYDQVPVFLTTEELATLWHFPNSKVQPPGLERVAAKRAEAPAGLPTGVQ